jgi:hypothetical protein
MMVRLTPKFPQRFFAQLGAGRQTLFEDGLEDMRVDNIVLGTAAAGFACSRLFLEGLQLFVHGHSSRENCGELTVTVIRHSGSLASIA